MNNPIHTHTTELDITCAGHTKTHELKVMYTYMAAIPASMGGLGRPGVNPSVPAQAKIHKIREFVINVDQGLETTFYQVKKTLASQYVWDSPEHIEAIEREILEELE